jgi:homogentisate 1,2-dioxygenase
VVEPGEIALVPRGVKLRVAILGEVARGYVCENYGAPFRLPDLGPIGANGLAAARDFMAPVAAYEDRDTPTEVIAKFAGHLWSATFPHSPFDVVAWHGNLCPYTYDLGLFSPVGATRIDHPDPSIYTVVTAPLDEPGAHTLDLVIFPARWDPTEGTFRPPYFHRNVTTEFNGIIRETVTPGSPFAPGCYFITPSMTPHGVMAAGVERALALDDAAADRPQRTSDRALWFQFETALPFSLSPWAQGAPNRIPDWPSVWGAYRKHFRAAVDREE